MKTKLFFWVTILLIFCNRTFSQGTWMPFDSSGRQALEVLNIQSNSKQLSFDVNVHGIYIKDSLVKNTLFERVGLPGADPLDSIGKPEVSYYSKLLAIPQCDSMILTIVPMDSVELTNFILYPRPLFQFDSIQNLTVEVFDLDSNAYSNNSFYPNATCLVQNYTSLRDQNLGRITYYPMKYNPVTQSLIIYTTFHVNIAFINPSTDVNIDVGMFGNVASTTLLNYTLTTRHAVPGNQNIPGSVRWKDPIGRADTIHGDYLIIVDSSMYIDNLSSPLYRFAHYRAQHNGLDIVIIKSSAARVYNPPFSQYFFLPFTHDEEHVRALIQQIYQGQNARHTFDHHLAYVLLIGRAEKVDILNHVVGQIIPAPTDQNPGWYTLSDPNRGTIASDYYYSCLSRTSNYPTSNATYSSVGDVFIGRFGVSTPTELSNIVGKIQFFETEAKFTSPVYNWMDNNLNNITSSWSKYQTWVNGLYHAPYYSINTLPPDPSTCQPGTWDKLNNNNVLTIFDYDHSGWNCNLFCTIGDYNNNFTTPYRFPFCVSHSCDAGHYDWGPSPQFGNECFAEAILNGKPNIGFIGMLASSRGINFYESNWPFSTPKYLLEYIPKAIWTNYATIAGEAILESKLAMVNNANGFQKEEIFGMNYFGDPALDLMAVGNYITANTILPCPQTISSPIIVKSPAVLTINPNCELTFVDRGSIYVEVGATLRLGTNVKVFGSTSYNNITVDGTLLSSTGTTTLSGDLFTCLNGSRGYSWGGLAINSTNGPITFSNCSFSYGTYAFNANAHTTYISGNLTALSSDTSCLIHFTAASSLNLSYVNFIRGQVLGDFPAQQGSGYPNLSMSNCVFHNESSSKDYVVRLTGQAFDISNNTITFNDNIGIDIQNTSWRFPSPYTQVINSNTISRPSAADDGSLGINLYDANTDIKKNVVEYNDYGISCVRNSTAYIPPSSSTGQCKQQTIAYNYNNQLYVSNSSWPPVVKDNIFDTITTNNPAQYWMYHDCTYCPLNRDVSYNKWSREPMHLSSFYPRTGSNWIQTPYCNSKDDPIPSVDEQLFLKATDSATAGNYSYASILYDSVVSQYPTSIYASPSIKSIFAIEECSSKNYADLKSKFQTDTIYYQSAELSKVTQFMIKECNLKLHNYHDALAWLDNEVLNCHDYADSICALIDIGYINTLMAHQGYKSLLSNAPNGEPLPISPKDNDAWYIHHLKDLFVKHSSSTTTPPVGKNNSKEINIISIGPNPVTKGTLNVDLMTLSDDELCLQLYNMEGKEVFQSGLATKANKSEVINISVENLPSGIYLLKLISKVTGESQSHKVVINK